MSLAPRSIAPLMAFAFAVAAPCVSAQSAAAPGAPGMVQRSTAPAVTQGANASPQERAALTKQFVNKWGTYVQRVYGVPVGTWARRMGPTFGLVDGDNFRNALKRDTFEGAMAELGGNGGQLTDAQMIDRFAAKAGAAGAVGTKALGALSNDLVYTPITPCRILDTRVVGGAIAAGFTRNFKAVNIADFSVQGGSATACGTSGQVATAVAINLTVVTPAGAGFATAYPFGTTRPLTATINYAAGSVVNNSVIVQIPNPVGSSDFTLYSFATADYVADIVGYFAPPVATALECTRQFGNFVSVPANTYGFGVSATCTTGYTATGLGIEAAANVVVADSAINNSGGTIFTYNLGGVAQSTRAWVQCCRVPGR